MAELSSWYFTNWRDLPVGRLGPKLHQQSRTGRNANVKRKKRAPIVTSPKARDSYIAKIQERVGFAKGTWINELLIAKRAKLLV